MNIKEAILFATNELVDVDSRALDARILLKFVLKETKDIILLDQNLVLTEDQTAFYKSLVEKRKKRVPVAYILGNKEFYGLNFIVSKDTLIPRPDSEILVESCLEYIQKNFTKNDNLVLKDICCGTGALIISILANLPPDIKVKAVAIDISKDALQIAKSNKLALLSKSRKLLFIEADIFQNPEVLNGDILISNPPYIPSLDINNLEKEISFEPRIALDGGIDGLDFYRFIAKNSKANVIMLEIGMGQRKDLVKMFTESEYFLEYSFKDLSGIERVLIFKRKTISQ